MKLVIVESPAKGKTIERILDRRYEVLASYGHVRDLPAKSLGVDVKKNFLPEYMVSPRSRKIVKILKNEIAKATEIYLATDYDREGEAIAWHIMQATGLGKRLKTKTSAPQVHRVAFHEITKPAVLEAIKHPRDIDLNLVDAQQARRILDRLVGYKLSPFLWQKVAQGLSAGRVQSVAVRLIVEREREIKKFVPQEFWQILVNLGKKTAEKESFNADLVEDKGQKIPKMGITDEAGAKKILKDLENQTYVVTEVNSLEKNRYPSPPFTTSTLQQEAARKFGFSAKKTMKLAQDLYEDGLITYMRTDSVSVSKLAMDQAKEVLAKDYGKAYVLEKPRFYQTKTKRAQEAHEAIRPTNLTVKTPTKEKDHERLYGLIWQRMLASQAREAVFNETNVKIKAGEYGFLATGTTLKFDGFLRIYGKNGEEKSWGQVLPNLAEKESLSLNKLEKNQHFTEPPNRYTEGTLVKELERRGIGRPSTYAPTLSTIVDRGYVKKVQGKLEPSEIAEVVTDLLVAHFPEIIDYDFTAKMEENLDEIAVGKLQWQKVTENFYQPFAKNLSIKMKEVSKKEITEEETKEKCPLCGKNLKIKLGRYGKFLACSGFPACKFTKPYLDNKNIAKVQEATEIAGKCPRCDKELVVKEGKFGTFLACSGYPECKFTKNIGNSVEVKCPNCDGKLVRKMSRRGRPFWGCSNYPKCKTAFWDEPQEKKCPKCGQLVTMNTKSKALKCSQCDWQESASKDQKKEKTVKS